MADVKWIKIVTDIFDDEKIRFIETMPNGDEIIVIWFKILCLCGKSNNGGFLMFTGKLAYTEEMLASIFNRDIKSIQMALKTFENLEMVEMIDNKIYIANWEKHQALDKLEAKKQYDREYQRKKREEKKQLLENRTTVKRLSNDNRATDIDKEIEEDIEKDKEIILSNSNELDCQTQDVRRVLEAWNELGAYGIKTVGKLKSGTQRYQMLQARIREYGIDDVLTAIENVKDSDFLQGKHSGKPWQITFDWFVRPNNFPKVLEGNYNGNANSQANGYTQMPYGNSRDVQFANLMEQIRRDEADDN